MLLSLPEEIIVSILYFSDKRIVDVLGMVCHKLHTISRDEVMWKVRVMRDYAITTLPLESETYREYYTLLSSERIVKLDIYNTTKDMKITYRTSLSSLHDLILVSYGESLDLYAISNKHVFHLYGQSDWEDAYRDRVDAIINAPGCIAGIIRISVLDKKKYLTFTTTTTLYNIQREVQEYLLIVCQYIPIVHLALRCSLTHIRPAKGILEKTICELLRDYGIKPGNQDLYPSIEGYVVVHK